MEGLDIGKTKQFERKVFNERIYEGECEARRSSLQHSLEEIRLAGSWSGNDELLPGFRLSYRINMFLSEGQGTGIFFRSS
jgi:hypothetical protein